MNESKDQLPALRHSAEHVLHQAMKELYPSIHLAMGPSTDDGYYFDFDATPEGREAVTITVANFPKIEKRMAEIIKKNLPITRHGISVAEARTLFADNPYKQEWIDDIEAKGEKVTIYWTGDPGKPGSMVDLCKGRHVAGTGEIKAFKLLSIAGAYWHGDEKNKMLTRIYGTAFSSQEELDKYLWQIEEAKKRDHKKLARDLDLIVFSDLVGAGLPLYTPKGALLRSAVYNYSRELNSKIGYGETSLPNMNRAELFRISGHYDKYKADMLEVKSHYSKEEFYLKPMNCPQHCVLYMSQPRSYRDLPIRYSDFSVLYRDERPGEINGILRSRAFTQDDGHCFCREDQIEAEFASVLGVIREALDVYGFKYWVRLSLHDPADFDKYLGTPAIWEVAESKLRAVVKESGVEYREGVGEAAIYGPKLDFMGVDSLGREWQISTIQLDMNMPGRFGLEYTDQEGNKNTPVMIHRAIIGSERFLAIIIEHYAGAFPIWLSPVQVAMLPISEHELEYAQTVATALKAEGIRVEVDENANTLGKKMVRAREQKVPYMAILGKQEVENKTITIKNRDGVQLTLTQDELIAKLKQEVVSKL